MLKICVVEDENSLAEMIRLNLELEGYDVTLVGYGYQALSVLEPDFNFDLIILDVMLPGINGIDLCRKIRMHTSTPILFLSAKGTTADRIAGLKAGGNDYLPKPFDLEELLLRVSILTDNSKKERDEIVMVGNCEINFKTYAVKNLETNKSSNLSKKELSLIRLFWQKEGEVISRTEILDKVWGKDQFPNQITAGNTTSYKPLRINR